MISLGDAPKLQRHSGSGSLRLREGGKLQTVGDVTYESYVFLVWDRSFDLCRKTLRSGRFWGRLQSRRQLTDRFKGYGWWVATLWHLVKSLRLIKHISLVYFRFSHTSILQERVMLTERITVVQMMMAKLVLRGNSLFKYYYYYILLILYITFC